MFWLSIYSDNVWLFGCCKVGIVCKIREKFNSVVVFFCWIFGFKVLGYFRMKFKLNIIMLFGKILKGIILFWWNILFIGLFVILNILFGMFENGFWKMFKMCLVWMFL